MNTTPIDRIRIYNRERFCIAEFKAQVSRSWSMNGEGRASFAYPTRKADVVNESVLQFGNYLLIENSALPAWVGVIDTPRLWASRSVTVSAYTPERILANRIGEMERVLNTSAGAIFEYIVNQSNTYEKTALTIGNVWKGGETRQETLHPTAFSEDLRRIRERSKEEYAWRPIVTPDGRLVIYADWTQRLGADYDVMLHEGRHGGNIEDDSVLFIEDGKIINFLFGYGEGSNWTSKPSAYLTDSDSLARYGLRMTGRKYDATTRAGVEKNVKTDIGNESRPVRRFSLTALNVGDTFKYIALGNGMTVQFQNVGFTDGVVGYRGKVRIIGMSYENATPNKIRLVVEES